MNKQLVIDMHKQPDDTTCGPTSLHAVYKYYEDSISLEEVISQVNKLDGGGTLAVMLGIHALKRGYKVTIYTYNLQVFDPSWFNDERKTNLSAKLNEQAVAKKNNIKLQFAISGYLEFLSLGGTIKFEDLTGDLIRKYLTRDIPILTGLSSTYLYNCSREIDSPVDGFNDIEGEPAGHFVVIYGYDKSDRKILVADPLFTNPLSPNNHYYKVDSRRLNNSILLGMITYDANLLIIEKGKKVCP